ncbi:MAG: DUF262 domain-containing protein [Chloroflexales bacterium]
MAITRSPNLLAYHHYLIDKALVPISATPSQALVALTTGDFDWVEIPYYQRGISWDSDKVDLFLTSPSVLLGNVIFSQFPIGDRFPYIPSQYKHYLVLVDGLQRFAIGTMILNILHPLVLMQNAQRTGDSSFFSPLSARVCNFAPVYQHNDGEFRNHPRQAIADQYTRLYKDVEDTITETLNSGQVQSYSALISSTFLSKQIAIDTYNNFTNPVQLMYTFLGLNTVRVDLGPVDLLRALLVQQATSANWRPEEIEEMENSFTDIFTSDERPDSELLPFVSVVLEAVNNQNLVTRIFLSWNTGLTNVEVDDFFDFVRSFKTCHNVNGYFDEIRRCGAIPLASLIIYYYCQTVHNNVPKPSFLNGGSAENPELHKFLVANYRVLLDGRIGRTRTYTERLLAGNIQSLEIAAEQMSNQFLRRDLITDVDRGWLVAALNKVDKNRAKIVFNAMLLPIKAQGWGASSFARYDYGSRSQQYNIDHLIPESMRVKNSAGSQEVDTLRNFAPLKSNQNRQAKATNCSSKLGVNGLYEVEICNHVSGVEPHHYWTWLVHTHASPLGSSLDIQTYLESNQEPDIGDQRINFIADSLMTRI